MQPEQAMPRAPWLPSVTESEGIGANQGGPSPSGAAGKARRLSEVHQQYLRLMERQAEVHEAFLTASRRSVAPAHREAPPLATVQAYWHRWMGSMPPFVESLYIGLIERFVGTVEIADHAAWKRLEGRSVLYLANHQVGIESLLFTLWISGLGQLPVTTLARVEHRTSWLGGLVAQSFSYPGLSDPGLLHYFDRSDRASLLGIVASLRDGLSRNDHSLLVHVEGELARSCRIPIARMSSLFVDLALEANLPIVPVRFAGGLPIEPAPDWLDFPLGYARQDFYLGRPLEPEALRALAYSERKAMVLRALNQVGPELRHETPNPPDPAFARAVAAWRSQAGVGEPQAVVLATLDGLTNPDPLIGLALQAVRGDVALPEGELGAWLGGFLRWIHGGT